MSAPFLKIETTSDRDCNESDLWRLDRRYSQKYLREILPGGDGRQQTPGLHLEAKLDKHKHLALQKSRDSKCRSKKKWKSPMVTSDMEPAASGGMQIHAGWDQ